MNYVRVTTSIYCSLLITCNLLWNKANGQPQLNSNTLINIGTLLPSAAKDSFVYIFDLGDSIFEYTELNALIEKSKEGRGTLRQETLQLTRMRHSKPQIFALVLIGTKYSDRTPRLLKDDCEDDELGDCYFTEIWMFVVTGDPSRNDLSSLKNPLLLVHVSFQDSNKRTNFIVHNHRAEIYPCQYKRIDAHDCLSKGWKRYDSILHMRQTCTNGLDPKWYTHRMTALKLLPTLGCHDFGKSNGTAFFEVLPRLESTLGIYPELNDFIISTRDSALLYIISPTVAQKSRNPYTSTLEPSTWLFLAVCLFLCGLFTFIVQRKYGNLDRVSAAWLFCIRLALDQHLKSMKPRRFLAIVGISAMLLTNWYRCYLHSEFTIVETGVPNNISEMADLLYTHSNISLVFADDYCEVVKKHRGGESYSMDLCVELGGNVDQCGFITQIFSLDAVLGFKLNKDKLPKYLKRLKGRLDSVHAVCTSEIQDIFSGRKPTGQVLPAFLTSQSDFPSTWYAIQRSIVDLREQKYTYKLDMKSSYFSPIAGVQFPMRLKSSQLWIRRNLRAMADSGIFIKETAGANENLALMINRRLQSLQIASQTAFQPISLSNSWLIVVIKFCSICFAISALVFAREMISTN